jgi:hypothetical protein
MDRNITYTTELSETTSKKKYIFFKFSHTIKYVHRVCPIRNVRKRLPTIEIGPKMYCALTPPLPCVVAFAVDVELLLLLLLLLLDIVVALYAACVAVMAVFDVSVPKLTAVVASPVTQFIHKQMMKTASISK